MMASAFNVLGGWCVVERKVGGRGGGSGGDGSLEETRCQLTTDEKSEKRAL